jgi:hypothetical protein
MLTVTPSMSCMLVEITVSGVYCYGFSVYTTDLRRKIRTTDLFAKVQFLWHFKIIISHTYRLFVSIKRTGA